MARPSPSPPPPPATTATIGIVLIFISFEVIACWGASTDAEALLKFKGSLEIENDALGSWAAGSSPCSDDKANWVGVLCEKGNVWGLKLENMKLKGSIDIETLEGVPQLRTLSLMNNDFEGSLPDVKRLGALKSLYLSRNHFSGHVRGDIFSSMLSLKKVHLAQNQLEGQIPWSLLELPRLLELRLEGNKFSGLIPNFHQKSLKFFNVSNNDQLHGPIPQTLSHMDPSSFSGIEGLCGAPLNIPCHTSKMPSIASIIMVSIAVTAALLAIGAGIVILSRRNQSSNCEGGAAHDKSPSASELGAAAGPKSPDRGSSHGSGSARRGIENAKLSFVRDDSEKFDLSDLLKASAEILGSGCFGSSYKAALSNGGPVMVVKRFKQMNNVDREEFQEHMRRIGRLKHANLLPLVAYYYKKEEKLLITDYIEKGSLAVHLHGHQSLGQPPLDWPARLKIVKGIGKGLRYLYSELPSLITPHGHLKSSNVLLKANFEPILSDYGLIPVVNQEHAQELMVAYKSPEYTQQGRITKKTDVWSYGLLILEILSGKYPANFLHQSKSSEEEDLASWVKSIPEKEWNSQVFDKDMGPTKNGDGEVMKLLRIALACCESDFEKRMDLREVVEKIDELKEKDGDEDFYSSYASEADIRSSRGLSDELNFAM